MGSRILYRSRCIQSSVHHTKCLCSSPRAFSTTSPSLSYSKPTVSSSIPNHVRSTDHQEDETTLDIDALLSQPTWSVSSLLPPSNAPPAESITPSKLNHLLRLSALPPPSSAAEQATMLKTLSSQLHFVKQIQSVDTEGVEPLRALRDETQTFKQEQEIGLDTLKDSLRNEEWSGTFWRRPMRSRKSMDEEGELEAKDWDPLENAARRGGQGKKYFVVDKGTGKKVE